jgi:hypothetical protein
LAFEIKGIMAMRRLFRLFPPNSYSYYGSKWGTWAPLPVTNFNYDLDEKDLEMQRSMQIEHLRSILDDFRLLPIRLLGREPDLYSSYDRLRAEAEFRAAIVTPLATLSLILARTWSIWWACGLAFVLLLGRQAQAREEASQDILFEALRAERVESPALQVLKDTVAKITKASPAEPPPQANEVPEVNSPRVDAGG